MTDQELAQALTGALDARIARAESAPVSFAGENRMPPKELIAATAVKAVPARQVRWKTAVAAVLALCVIGSAGLLLRPSLQRLIDGTQGETTVSANCHQLVFPDGETAWVMDRAYEGEYDVQQVAVEIEYDPDYPAWIGKVEDGFLQQTIMNYDDYAAYCARFGVTQTYTDRDSHYLIASNAAAHVRQADALPVDLEMTGNQAVLWLWDNAASGMVNDTVGYVLTIPVPAEVETMQCYDVYTAEEAAIQTLYHSTTITEQADGTYCIEGWCVGYFPQLLYYGSERIGLKLDEETEIDTASMQKLSRASADCFGFHLRAEGCVRFEPTRAESNENADDNTDVIVDHTSPYDGMDRVFTVAKLTILDDADAPAVEEPTQNTNPSVEDENPVVTFEEDSKTLRVVGTGNYDKIDLSRLPDATSLVVEDDDFEYRIQTSILSSSESRMEDPISYLPGYLEHVDQSLATIRKFVADNAPNEDVIAQTRKRVKLSLNTFRYYNILNGSTIDLELGGVYRQPGIPYTMALLNPSTAEWKHLAYGNWVENAKNPYSPEYFENPEVDANIDYLPYSYYFQAGGSGNWQDVNTRILLDDIISWCNLVFGRDWGGNVSESGKLSDILPLLDASKEENRLSEREASSLLNYLAEQYGADKVTAYCFDACSFEEAFGTDFAAARAAWEQSLLERFGDGSDRR